MKEPTFSALVILPENNPNHHVTYSLGIVLWEIVSRAFPYWEYEELKDQQRRKLSEEQLNDHELLEKMRKEVPLCRPNSMEVLFSVPN